jgi:hypothetical protein
MKWLVLIGLSLFLNSCDNGNSYTRGYVISKSHLEPEADAAASDQEIEPAGESTLD